MHIYGARRPSLRAKEMLCSGDEGEKIQGCCALAENGNESLKDGLKECR